MNFNGTVQASSAMYKTLAKTHIGSSWGYTLAKEIWQNTIDLPTVSLLDIKTERVTVDNHDYDWYKGTTFTRVTFVDNGPGMNLDTLKRVYLFYGETTKSHAEDSVGGYGLGRVVCTFGALEYRLRSKDWECEGKGPEYKVSTGLKPVEGFTLEVLIPNADRAGNTSDARLSIKDYLSKCFSSRIKVLLNGASLDIKPLPMQDKITLSTGDEEWGSYISTDRNQIQVWAVNSSGDGLFLNEEFLYGLKDKGIKIFVKAGLTKKAMNIARDKFSGEYGEAIDAIKASLYAVQKHQTKIQTFIEGGEDDPFILPKIEGFKGKIHNVKDTLAVNIHQVISQGFEKAMAEKGQRLLDNSEDIPNPSEKDAPDPEESIPASKIPYMFLCSGADKPKYQNMKDDTKYEGFYRVWKALVETLAENVLLPICPKIGGRKIQCAILLSEEAHGVCHSGWKTDTIGGNPESLSTFAMCVATAMHEVCHIAADMHDETYAIYLTYCMAGLYGAQFTELELEWNAWNKRGPCPEPVKKEKETPKPIKKETPKPIKKKVSPSDLLLSKKKKMKKSSN